MADPHIRQIQEACDDLYCAPLDPVAQAAARHILLQAIPPLDERTHARRIKIACDELHDDPSDLDARRALLALLDLSAAASRPDVPTSL